MRAMTATPVLMRRFDVPARQQQHAPVPEMRGTTHGMPFVALPVMRDERGWGASSVKRGLFSDRSPGGGIGHKSRTANRRRSGTSRVEPPTAAAQPQIDLDEIVEKAWEKLMRKLTIEQERRGYSRWS